VINKRGSAHRTDDLQLRFGVVIRESRRRLGISQEELGWRAGLHRTYITDVERGVRNISIRSIASLAAALEVSISSLFARADEIPSGKAPILDRLEVASCGVDGKDGVGKDGMAKDGGNIARPAK